MNKDEKSKIKVGIIIAASAIIIYLLLQNLSTVSNALTTLLGLFSSFIGGIGIAFVLNILMCFFEKRVYSKAKWFSKHKKFLRPASLVTTIIVFIGILTALISFIIPQFVDSAKTLAENFQGYLASMNAFFNSVAARFGISGNLNEMITEVLTSLSDYIITFITTAAPKIITTTVNITSGILNVFIAFIFAIYMLASKETLLRGAKKVLFAFTPLKVADYTTNVYRLVKVRFTGFVTGQLTEAVIMGVLCFLGMSLFGMEYALLISVIVGFTNMIPIVGPIIGAIPGALIMLMVDPMMALWFVIFIIVLQQLESNIIYPKVVGDSIGLPGIWVLFAIIVGGNLFGFFGILLGVPVLAVIYSLVSTHTDTSLKAKGLKL